MRLLLQLVTVFNIIDVTYASLRPWSLGVSTPIRHSTSTNNRESLLLERQRFVTKSNNAVSNCWGSDHYCKSTNLIQSLRGGSSTLTKDEEEDSDSEYEEEYDSEEVEEDEDYDDEESDVEEDEEDNDATLATSIQTKAASDDEPYDTLLTPPPMQQMMLSISIMFLSQRMDIFSPRVVTIARAAFVAYIILVQLFLLYVRTKVKQINDRTEITLSNPLASMAESMLQKNSNNDMVKSLTSQILTTHTTIYEYDMQQIKSMQSGLLMPMVFIYFLHFRMKQMQPLLMQTVTGLMNLVYSPLWQVYVMGKRLERPFGGGGGGNNNKDDDGLLGGVMGENESDVSDVVEKTDDDSKDDVIDVNNESDGNETEEEDSDDESDDE